MIESKIIFEEIPRDAEIVNFSKEELVLTPKTCVRVNPGRNNRRK
jgi:hypothetical protein